MYTRGGFAVMITNFEMKRAPPLEVGYNDIENLMYLFSEEIDALEIVGLRHGVDQYVEELPGGRAAVDVLLCSWKMFRGTEMQHVP